MTSFQDLAVAMLKCEQTKGQTVYQHGVSVRNHFDELINNPCGDKWRLPDWLFDYKDQILMNLHNEDIITEYLIFHDCSKPFCREVDSEGKVHFPNHAELSKKLFLEAGGNSTSANLVGWDMEIHTASSIEIENWCKIWTVKDACTLLLASLAEVHSNARLFGGISSISFKSKFKQIDRRGRQICKHYFGEIK